jgi:hypothetical protein
MGKRLATGLVVVVAFLGLKLYNKRSSSQQVKAHLTTLCAGDSACATAVDTHFEGCFDSAYKLGGRRSSSHLEGGQLVQCINARAGKPYFTYDASKE